MYVILFGSAGQILEFKMKNEKEIADLLKFLNQEFNGGTDFNTPLKRTDYFIINLKLIVKQSVLVYNTDKGWDYVKKYENNSEKRNEN